VGVHGEACNLDAKNVEKAGHVARRKFNTALGRE
jgi:hypothetical protein